MQSSSKNRVAFLGSWISFLAMSICLLVPANSARAHGAAEDMVEAANAFLSALDDSQRDKATFPWKDEERSNWHFIPRSRNGLPLKEMTASQQQLAYALLQSALRGQRDWIMRRGREPERPQRRVSSAGQRALAYGLSRAIFFVIYSVAVLALLVLLKHRWPEVDIYVVLDWLKEVFPGFFAAG